MSGLVEAAGTGVTGESIMNEIISKRKSVRKYDKTPLEIEILDRVGVHITKLKPLFPDIRYSVEIVSKTKGLFNIKAPHYLVFRSEIKEGAYENTGFIGQQMDLFLSGSGLGSCWLGASKPEGGEKTDLSPVACIAFGKPAEPLHRQISEFKRKSLPEISEGSDERLEAARLAPSGMNAQGWYFIVDSGKIHCYCKKPGLVSKLISAKLGFIDIGIALCHIARGASASSNTDDFIFGKEEGIPERKGYIYIGTVN